MEDDLDRPEDDFDFPEFPEFDAALLYQYVDPEPVHKPVAFDWYAWAKDRITELADSKSPDDKIERSTLEYLAYNYNAAEKKGARRKLKCCANRIRRWHDNRIAILTKMKHDIKIARSVCIMIGIKPPANNTEAMQILSILEE